MNVFSRSVYITLYVEFVREKINIIFIPHVRKEFLTIYWEKSVNTVLVLIDFVFAN